MAQTMKRWTLNAVGRENLALAEVPVPTPGPGQVLVRVAAVSLNYRDKLVIETGMGLDLPFPLTPLSDMAGEVAAVGTGVARFAAGDRVISTFVPGWIDGRTGGSAARPGYATLGGLHQGVLAEYVVLDQDWLTAAPAGLTPAEASTLPIAGLTAWFSLFERGGLKAGETVVVQGTGGVALFGLQFAKAAGAEVIVTSGDDAKLARARALGADHGINRLAGDWAEAVIAHTGGRGADHILELAGGANLDRSVAAAAVGGRIAMIGQLEGFELKTRVVPLLLKEVTVFGVVVGHRRAQEDMVRAVDRIGLRPVIDARYPLADLPAALDHLDRGPFGKIVIEVG